MDDCDGVFLSVDVDVCDPGHAPGTGTPEPGGLTARAAAGLRAPDLPRAAGGRHGRRGGVAAVRPRGDHRGLANRVVLEALSGMAVRRRGLSHDPAGPLLEDR